MNHINSHKSEKNTKNPKNIQKSPQELYDKYIRKGDEAVISEDLVLAEKYYQHADHCLRLMNDPNLFENDPDICPLTLSRSVREVIVKALKGIAAEKAAKKEAIREKAIEVAKAVKAALPEQKGKAKGSRDTQRGLAAQTKALNCQNVVEKRDQK